MVPQSKKRAGVGKRQPVVEIPVRVTIVRAPAGVQFSLGRTDDGEAHETKFGRGKDLWFDFMLRARLGVKGKPFSILGKHARGPASARFIPIGVGRLAGQTDSCWTRVIKVHLSGITPRLVSEIQRVKGARLVVRVDGQGSDGTPACASVPLLGDGWSVE